MDWIVWFCDHAFQQEIDVEDATDRTVDTGGACGEFIYGIRF